jgi:Fe-S cluster assembly protein SufD
LPEAAGAHRLVFVGGLFRPELSRLERLPVGVTLASLAASLDDAEVAEALGRIARLEDSPLTALNAALFRDGFLLKLGANVEVTAPIEVVHVGLPGEAPAAAHLRNLILAAPGARATVVEYHVCLGEGVHAFNGITEVRLEREARLRLYKVQAEGGDAFHLQRCEAELADGAEFESFGLTLGARLSRNEIHVALNGRGAQARVHGAYALAGKQHADTLTAVDHRGVDTLSRQVFKGVLDDSSHAVFQGKVRVAPGARGADGQQLNKTLLLSRKAEIDSKPELEILADDVKCSHGATAGELAEEAIFYLRSRGIPPAEARHLLVEAFLAEAVAEVGDATVAEAMRGLIQHWLAGQNRRNAA